MSLGPTSRLAVGTNVTPVHNHAYISSSVQFVPNLYSQPLHLNYPGPTVLVVTDLTKETYVVLICINNVHFRLCLRLMTVNLGSAAPCEMSTESERFAFYIKSRTSPLYVFHVSTSGTTLCKLHVRPGGGYHFPASTAGPQTASTDWVCTFSSRTCRSTFSACRAVNTALASVRRCTTIFCISRDKCWSRPPTKMRSLICVDRSGNSHTSADSFNARINCSTVYHSACIWRKNFALS